MTIAYNVVLFKNTASTRAPRSEILVKQSVSLGKNLHVYTAYCRLKGGWGGGIIRCIVFFTGRRAYNWGKRWWGLSVGRGISGGSRYEKQLLGEVFVISGIIKVEVRTRLITLTETLIIPDITKTKSKHC